MQFIIIIVVVKKYHHASFPFRLKLTDSLLYSTLQAGPTMQSLRGSDGMFL